MTNLPGPMGAPFQRGQIVAVESTFPPVEALPADVEMPTGSHHVAAIEVVEQHPLQSPLCCLAQLLPEARQLASLGELIPPYLVPPDTLPSGPHHSERTQSPD